MDPEVCSSWLVPRTDDPPRSLDWILTIRIFDPEEAWPAALASRAIGADNVVVAARDLAELLGMQTSAVSCVLVRAMLWDIASANQPHGAHLRESPALGFIGGRDACAGVAAFLQKRTVGFRSAVPTDLSSWFFAGFRSEIERMRVTEEIKE